MYFRYHSEVSFSVILRISGAEDSVDSNSLNSVIYVYKYTPVNHNVLLKSTPGLVDQCWEDV